MEYGPVQKYGEAIKSALKKTERRVGKFRSDIGCRVMGEIEYDLDKILAQIVFKMNQVVREKESTDELTKKLGKLTKKKISVCLDGADNLSGV